MPNRLLRSLLLAVLFAVLGAGAGCASRQQYRYAAERDGLERFDGDRGVTYSIPAPEDKRGEVRVMTYGPVELGVQQIFPDIRAMHMRLELTNARGARARTLDTRRVFLEIPGEGRSEPAYVNTDGTREELPELQILPGEKRVVDLYYPLPQGMNERSEIPEFKLEWSLALTDRVIQKVVAFNRYPVAPVIPRIPMYPPYAASSPHGLGWGPVWWYEPSYARWTWHRPVPVYPLS